LPSLCLAGVSDVEARKHALRASARKVRADAHRAHPDAPARIAARVKALAATFGPPGIASGYLPIRDELDPRPVMAVLVTLGWQLALPVVTGPRRPLSFRSWAPGESLVPASFGLEVPAAGAEVTPGLLFVPMLAFDARGHRLGYGGGFYDRTIAALRARNQRVRAVGIAFAAQQVARVPDRDTDMRLDAILTEAGHMPIA
jgi:5-formyltetrahydrofolate cyclo-ligase